MHTLTIYSLAALLCIGAALTPIEAKTKVEQVPQECVNLALDDRPVVAVSDFKVRTNVTGDVGGGMTSMLANALTNTGCFAVVERQRINEVMEEQAFGMSGAVAESTASSVGELVGARYLVQAELTEFMENESGAGAGVRTLGRLFSRRAGAVAGSVDFRVAHIGFVIKIVDTQNGMVIGSSSFDAKRKSAGFAAAGWSGAGLFSGTGQISKAMADAIEEAIIDAAGYMTRHRHLMEVAAERQQTIAGGAPALRPGECSLLQNSPRGVRVMVLIPEEHVTGNAEQYAEGRAFKNFDDVEVSRNMPPTSPTSGSALAPTMRMIRPPDPAGETEIAKRFIQQGFTVVDAGQLDALREEDARYRRAFADIDVAREIGGRFDADIVVVGEALSEFSRNVNGMMSARARVEAKAIETRTGRILATDGFHASGLDISEVIAGKGALRDAGGKIADAFLVQICGTHDLALGSVEPVPQAERENRTGSGATTQVVISNIDFMIGSRVSEALEALEIVSRVETSFADGTATLEVAHAGQSDDLAMTLARSKDMALEIVSVDRGRVLAQPK